MAFDEWTEEDFPRAIEVINRMQEWLAIAGRRSQDPAIQLRCSRAELTMRAVLMMLKVDPEGNADVSDPSNFIAEKIKPALYDFGLDVVRFSGEAQRPLGG